jgi:hypothetical protein
MLQPLSRQCFVLQILVGLSRSLRATLDLSTPDFEGALYAAFIELLLRSPKG